MTQPLKPQEIEAVRALIDYHKSVDSFYRTSNLLLDRAGVTQAQA